jgi:lysophospholipase L1-like esterase
MALSNLHTMTGPLRISSSSLPFLNPVAFSSLFVIAAAAVACGGSDDRSFGGAAGHTSAAGSSSSAAGSNNSAGGAGNAAGAPGTSGGSVGVGGDATAGSPTTSGGSSAAGSSSVGGSSSVAGGGNVAGSSSGGAGGGSTGATKWVGTWTASPYATASDGQPPVALSNSVARQITHASLGGNQIRVQFSNIIGTSALTIKAAHVALCKASPVDGSIDTTTDKALAFSGMAGVTIAAGKEVWSDPLDFALPALGNVSITTAFGTVPSDLTSHNGARTDSYVVGSSTDVSAANMTSAQHNQHWWVISGMDVMAPMDAKGIVAIGDSITDGRGVTPNANNRWTDDLAKRLHDNAATANVSLMNQGIGATNLVGTGTAAEARFQRDVLGQSGVKYVIIFDGVNDIGNSGNTTTTFNSMKGVYDKLVKAGRAQGLLVYGATITPFNGNSYYSADHETLRQQVNTYIKSGAFDGVVDFDAAVSDGKTPPSLLTAANSADGLHPGPAGYQLMADKVDLTLFTK